MRPASAASVRSSMASLPRAKPSSITTLRPWPITSTIAADSRIATNATPTRERWGASSRKSGRSFRRSARSAAATHHGARDSAGDGEGAAVLGHLRADLEGRTAVERAVGTHVDGAVAAQHATLQVDLAEVGVAVGRAVLAAQLGE